MKTDQDLIFEAYATTLNESDESGAKNIQRGQEAISAAQEEYYKQFGAEAFEDHYGFPYPHAEDNEVSAGVLEQLEFFMQKNPETEQELAPILNELLEIAEELVKFDDFMDGEAQDEYLYLLNKLSTTAKT